MMKTKNGFTLIELMIVVVIIGILASMAYPAYIENVRTTKRATAQSDLLELASFLERRFTENNSYLIPNGSTDPLPPATACTTAGGCTPSLANGVIHDDYNYSFSAVTASTYILQAVPQNEQTNDKCGTMTRAETSATTAATTNCWR